MRNKKDNEDLPQDNKPIEQYTLNGIIYKIIVSGNQTEKPSSALPRRSSSALRDPWELSHPFLPPCVVTPQCWGEG